MKKILAVLVIAVIFLTPLSGCYKSANVLTIEGYNIYPGLYLYFQLQAIAEAAEKFDNLITGKELYAQTIDNIPARDWINNRTVGIAREFVFVNREFERLGLDKQMLDLEMSYYESSMKSEWQQIAYFYMRNGVGYETFYKEYEYLLMSNQVFSALYVDEGGELEVPEKEIIDYFSDNYIYLDYITLKKTDEYGLDLDEDIIEELREEAEDMRKVAVQAASEAAAVYSESENTGLQAAFDWYLAENSIPEDEAQELREGMVIEQVIVTPNTTGFDAGFLEELNAAAPNRYQVYETDSLFYLYCRRSMLEYNEDSWTDYKSSIVSALRGDEYTIYLAEYSRYLYLSENRGARRYFSLNKVFMA